MRAIILIIFCLFFGTGAALAQGRFSVDDNYRFLNKPVSAGILHHYIQARNHTGDTLHMRWKKYVYDNPPAAWLVNFADPQQNRPDISNVDSADFTLPDSANWVYNKFVIGINPNDSAGTGRWVFTIFERQNPADSLQIEYEVLITSGLSLEKNAPRLHLYPNPTSGCLYLKGWPLRAESVTLQNAEGKSFVAKVSTKAGLSALDISHLPKGVYYLSLQNEKQIAIKKIIIQ